MADVPWSGVDFLDTVNGPSERFPPLRVLFLVHRVGASGRLSVRSGVRERTIHLQAGRVVAAAGFPNLLDHIDVSGEQGDDLVGLVGRAVARGHTPDRAIEAATEGLARALAAWADLKGAIVQFDRRADEPRSRMPIAESVPRLLGRGLRLTRTPELLRAGSAPRLRNPVRLSLPDDSPEQRWGLDPVSSRLLREAGRGGTLGELLGLGSGSEALHAVDLLSQLGLIYVEGATAAPRPATVSRPPEPRGPDPRSVSTSSVGPRSVGPASVGPRSVGPASVGPRSVGPASVGPRSVGPASVGPRSVSPPSVSPSAVPPSGGARPDAELIETLRETLASMTRAEPAAILGLKRSADLSEAGVDRAFRDVSVRFHPDRHHNASAEVKDLAARCFSRASDAYTALKDPAAREEAQARLKAQEEGRVYVSEMDRRLARLAFARGEIAFRARRFLEALVDLELAAERDPGTWRYDALRLQAACLAGQMDAKQADAALALLLEKVPEGAVKADLLYAMGELLLRENLESAAQARFTAALKENPEHVGAKRRAWLQKRRADEVEASKGGLFGGLLGKKK